jgi:hypothetical protein
MSGQISVLVGAALDETYRASGSMVTEEWVGDYRRERADQLRCFVARYAGDPLVGPLVALPELVAILERLERDPTGLVAHWPHELPRMWLDTLAELWGSPL